VNFKTAIKSGFQNYANFNGRSSRSAYWFWNLFNLIVALLLSVTLPDIGTIFSIATIVPSLAVGWRRMHDTNRGGWWSIIPLVGFIVALQRSDPNMNQYGPPAPPVF